MIENRYVKVKIVRMDKSGEHVKVTAVLSNGVPLMFTMPIEAVDSGEADRLRRLAQRQSVKCLIHSNWTVRKGGKCKRWSRCLQRGSLNCVASGPA